MQRKRSVAVERVVGTIPLLVEAELERTRRDLVRSIEEQMYASTVEQVEQNIRARLSRG